MCLHVEMGGGQNVYVMDSTGRVEGARLSRQGRNSSMEKGGSGESTFSYSALPLCLIDAIRANNSREPGNASEPKIEGRAGCVCCHCVHEKHQTRNTS